MYYLSGAYVKGDESIFGITDTEDNVQELYTINQVLAFINKGVKIRGVTPTVHGFRPEVLHRIDTYSINRIVDKKAEIFKAMKLVDSNNMIHYKEEISKLYVNGLELTRMLYSGVKIDGLDTYMSSDIEPIDYVVLFNYNKRCYVVNSAYLRFCGIFENYPYNIEFSKLHSFEDMKSAVDYCKCERRITKISNLVNDLTRPVNSYNFFRCYFHNSDEFIFDMFVKIEDVYVGVKSCIIDIFLPKVLDLREQRRGFGLDTYNYWLKSYDDSTGYFTFDSDYDCVAVKFSSSFCSLNYNWTEDIKRHGICIENIMWGR